MELRELVEQVSELVHVNRHGTIVYQAGLDRILERPDVGIGFDLLMDIVSDNAVADPEGGETIDWPGVQRDLERVKDGQSTQA